MNILFSSNKNPYFVTITEYIERALSSFGNVTFYNNRGFVLPGRVRKSIGLCNKIDLHILNKRLEQLALKCRPDLFIEAGGHRIFPSTVKKIKTLGIKTVLWTIDAPTDFKPIISAAPFYDFVFTGGSEAFNILKKYSVKNLFWLPFACDTEYAKPIAGTSRGVHQKKCAVSFVGSYYPNRMKTLEAISDFDLGVWGPGWDAVPDDSPLKKRIIKAGNITHYEWQQIFVSSDIALVIHFNDPNVPCHQASPKVYEIMACRAFLLCDNQKDVLSLFKNDKHLAIYSSPGELRDKIKYYLNNSGRRKRIAENGYNEVCKNHTYIHRIEELLSKVTEKV